jgi:hypothetical protein
VPNRETAHAEQTFVCHHYDRESAEKMICRTTRRNNAGQPLLVGYLLQGRQNRELSITELFDAW